MLLEQFWLFLACVLLGMIITGATVFFSDEIYEGEISFRLGNVRYLDGAKLVEIDHPSLIVEKLKLIIPSIKNVGFKNYPEILSIKVRESSPSVVEQELLKARQLLITWHREAIEESLVLLMRDIDFATSKINEVKYIQEKLLAGKAVSNKQDMSTEEINLNLPAMLKKKLEFEVLKNELFYKRKMLKEYKLETIGEARVNEQPVMPKLLVVILPGLILSVFFSFCVIYIRVILVESKR